MPLLQHRQTSAEEDGGLRGTIPLDTYLPAEGEVLSEGVLVATSPPARTVGEKLLTGLGS